MLSEEIHFQRTMTLLSTRSHSWGMTFPEAVGNLKKGCIIVPVTFWSSFQNTFLKNRAEFLLGSCQVSGFHLDFLTQRRPHILRYSNFTFTLPSIHLHIWLGFLLFLDLFPFPDVGHPLMSDLAKYPSSPPHSDTAILTKAACFLLSRKTWEHTWEILLKGGPFVL